MTESKSTMDKTQNLDENVVELDMADPEAQFVAIANEREAMRLLEALLFSSKDPLTVEDLTDAVPGGFDVLSLLEQLQADYQSRGIVLENNGPYWAFRTASDLAERLTIEREEVRKLSRAGLETLAIIAYHQPVTRAEIEDIRGVAVAKGTVDALLELGWIRPRGRKRAPGRPLMWGTTDEFLDHFGLTELEELPGVKELKDSGLLDRAPSLKELEDDDDSEDDSDEESDAEDEGLDTQDGQSDIGSNDPAMTTDDDQPDGHNAMSDEGQEDTSNVVPLNN